MSTRDDCLPALDAGRALLDVHGLRRFDLVMRVNTYSGARVGAGTKTTTNTTLTLDGSHRIKAKRVSGRDIMASGGLYQEGDWRVGPFTPAFAGGGRDPSYFDPPASASVPQEVYYQLTGPGFSSGAWFKKVDTETSNAFGYYITLRAINVVDP